MFAFILMVLIMVVHIVFSTTDATVSKSFNLNIVSVNQTSDRTILRNKKKKILPNRLSIANQSIDNTTLVVQPQKNLILVILHIPKTSGTHWYKLITRKLFTQTSDNVYTKSCQNEYGLIKCKFNSYSRNTEDIFRQSQVCNTHSGYSDLIDCIKAKRPYLSANSDIQMITFLREPVKRYISQIYYRPDGLWARDLSEKKCPNFKLYDKSCNTKSTWQNSTWQTFLECDYNRAINQQMRMLANYDNIGCDVLSCWLKSSDCTQSLKESNENKMLESAKKTLKSMKFFGLTEYQELSEYLFEKTFDNKYKFSESLIDNEEWDKISWNNFVDRMKIVVRPVFKSELNVTKIYEAIDETEGNTVASRKSKRISDKDLDLVSQLNSLDMELYKFAKDLFFKRIKKIYNLSE